METTASSDVVQATPTTAVVVDAETVVAPLPLVDRGRKRRKINAHGPWRSSHIWLHFYLVRHYAIATAACKHCHKRYLCNPKLQGTSNMLAHSEACNKNALVIGNDRGQLNHNHLVVID